MGIRSNKRHLKVEIERVQQEQDRVKKLLVAAKKNNEPIEEYQTKLNLLKQDLAAKRAAL